MYTFTTQELVLITWILDDFNPNDRIVFGSHLFGMCDELKIDGYVSIPIFETQGLLQKIPGTGDLYEESQFYVLDKLLSEAAKEGITPRPRVTLEVAEIRAYQIACQDPSFAKNPSIRVWAEEIGCAYGTVQKLGFYQACVEKSGKSQSPKIERALFHDDPGLATIDSDLETAKEGCSPPDDPKSSIT